MQLVIKPEQFDVIVDDESVRRYFCRNEAAGLIGGLGLAPGANIGAHARHLRAGCTARRPTSGEGSPDPSPDAPAR